MKSTADNMAIILDHLTKQFDKTTVLHIPNLSLEVGKVHVIIGPNGAGKTTLLRILAGIEPPSSGEVRVFRRKIWNLSGQEKKALQRRLAFCAPKPYLFHTTVRRNIEYPLRVRGFSTNECKLRANQIMKELEICPLANRNAQTLSAGESQKVSIARALVYNPDLLLLDEPSANLHRDAIPLIETILRSLVKTGTTIIVATHSVEHAYRLSARIVRLQKGQLAPSMIENLIQGEIINEPAGPVFLAKSDLRIAVETDRRGQGNAAIAPMDIVISLNSFNPNTRNHFTGYVISLEERNNMILVTTDVGVPLTSCITYELNRELKLTIGTKVVLSFDSTAVRTYN